MVMYLLLLSKLKYVDRFAELKVIFWSINNISSEIVHFKKYIFNRNSNSTS